MNFFPKDCKHITLIMFILAISAVTVVLFGTFFKGGEILENDPLNKVLFKIGPVTISWWPISHFLLYAILGFFFPTCFIPLMILGILWELFELLLGILSKKRQSVTRGVQYGDKWWSANLFDPFFNAAGFLVGMLIAKLVS